MKEIIQLLPDQLANQIAAGEVIQRPASAVKELLENALDAGATEIQLIIKDAGKELIQVVDNGCGMSPIDARMSFERHATSKIKSIEDLFAIKTMGFRGEALASIAAVAQVELKTRPVADELGTLLQIESGEVKKQEPVACPAGTNFAVRNLFYNVPARRKFLKSNTSEYKHIMDEFTHVAMAFPEICFRLFHNQTEQFCLESGNLKGRIMGLLGNKTEQKLIPVSGDFEILKIEGFVGKPAAATKTRGNQFFFVNNRFIRSSYLNHAVVKAFEGLIDKDAYPLYVLQISMDAESVDVNVHPSKQEVKFDDEQMIYAYVHAAVKHALARYNITPSLDFTLSPDIQNSDAVRLPFSEDAQKAVQSGFLAHSFSQSGRAHFLNSSNERKEWDLQKKAFFPQGSQWERPVGEAAISGEQSPESFTFRNDKEDEVSCYNSIIRSGAFLATTVKSGILLVHRKRAKERIVFESLQMKLKNENTVSQPLLFPFELEESPSDMVLFKEAIPFLKATGFGLEVKGTNQLMVTALPQGVPESSGSQVLSGLLEQIKLSPLTLKDPLKIKLLTNMANRIAQKDSDNLINDESLIDELFACENAQVSPSGNKIYVILSQERLNSLL